MDDLFDAIAGGDVDTVRVLIAAHPDYARGRRGGVSAVLWALYHGEAGLAAELAEAAGPLDVFEAAALDRADRVRELVEERPECAQAHSPDGFPALGLAAYFGAAAALRVLLDAGAEANVAALNATRVTPLHSAAAARRADLVRVLLAAGADPDARQEGGWTALHQAAHVGDTAMVDALLAAGADPDAPDDEGSTPVDLADRDGHAHVAARLRAQSRR